MIMESNARWRQRNQDDNQIGSQHNATTTAATTAKGVDDHDGEDTPKGGKYARRVKARRRDWRLPRRYVTRPSKVDDGDAVFLFIAERRVMTATTLLLTAASGASSLLGAGTMTIILGLSSPKTTPWTTTMTKSWLGSWWGPNDGSNLAAPVVNGGNFSFGFSPL
jgi:hypothetical protein